MGGGDGRGCKNDGRDEVAGRTQGEVKVATQKPTRIDR